MSPGLLVILSIVFAGMTVFVCTYAMTQYFLFQRSRSRKHRKDLRSLRKFLFLIPLAFLGAYVCELIAHTQFASDKLPNYMWAMFLPFSFSLCITACVFLLGKIGWVRWFSIALPVVGIILSLALVNNFYNFYPTLYSIFGNDTKKLLAIQGNITKYITKVKTENKTLEGDLYNSNVYSGTVSSITVPGTLSGFNPRPEWVYLPPIANSNSTVKLPVVVLLPGYPGLTSNWLDGGLKKTMDQFAFAHHGITPIVVVADDTGSVSNDTECVDSPRGNIETYLTKDVPNYVKAHYNVMTDSSHWAIGGLSMGGMCSLMLALRHTDTYGNFLDFSGEIAPEVGSRTVTIDTLFGGSVKNWQEHQPFFLLDHNPKKYVGMGAYMTIGRSDGGGLISGMDTLFFKLKAAGVETIYERINGEHTFKVWETSFRMALPWLSNKLGATECDTTCSQ